MNEQIWWYVARSGGIVAWGLVSLSVCWGLFLSTKAVAKASQPARLLNLHRFLGGLAVAFTGVHIAGLVADRYVSFGWLEILVPWTSEWKPTAVAWGVIALYLLLAVEITSLFMKRLPRPVWRQIHRSSFGLYVLSTVHGIQAGSDTLNVWYRMAMLTSINIVAFLTIVLVLAHRRAAASRRTATA
ncbi:MAG: ferric reductase-like transmembrane domain-containing protein [Acidimicrobiia bacterium]|nr:ferric reductase-like transmembrane domain-containing protein [Acidimicrobiia bacterium]